MKKALRLIASGRVQGVGFRYFTRARAQAEGIKGTVQNLPDGNVEIYAEGKPAALDRFYAQVQKGPPLGRVDELKTGSVPLSGYSSFDII